MAWTKFNNVTLTNGSREVTVNDGTSVAEILAGFDLVKDGLVYELDTPNAGNLMLVDPWPNTTEASASIKVRQTHAPIANQIHQAIQRLSANSDTFEGLKEGAFLDVANGLEGGTLQAIAFKQLATDQEALNGVADKIPNALQVAKNRKRKNYIVNPSMAISQENEFDDISVGAANVFLADQWFAQNSGSGATVNSSFQILDNLRALRVTATAAATDLTGVNRVVPFRQILEAQNIHVLNGRTVVIAFKVRVNWTGNLPISVLTKNQAKSYVTDVAVVPGINYVASVLDLEPDTVANIDNEAGLEIIIGANNEGDLRAVSGDENKWIADNLFCSANSTQWAKTNGNYVEITAVKLEEGSTPTVFEPNSYRYDLEECQRYSRKISSSGTFRLVGATQRFNATIYRLSFPFEMRDLPVIYISSGSGTIEQVGASSTQDVDAITALENIDGYLFCTASTVGGDAGSGNIVLNNGGFIFFNSRL